MTPETPLRRPTLDEVADAERALADVVVPTSLVPKQGVGAELWLAPEVHQRVGSFKLRGVHYAALRLSEREREHGLATVSAGNTAQALAWSARSLGVPARSLMPEHAPRAKIEAVRALGGEPVLVPVDELFRYMRERGWESEPYAFVHPWTDPAVHVGHGTLGLELVAAAPWMETVFVPVGGGGLLAGVGSVLRAARPDVRIVAVEPVGCAALSASLEAGRAVAAPCSTICDGVAVPYLTNEMYPLLSELVDEVLLVEEDEVRAAVRALALEDHLIAEGAGALATAAALRMPVEDRGRSIALVTGGCIEPRLLVEILGAGFPPPQESS